VASLAEIFRLVALEPQDFRRGVAGEHIEAGALDEIRRAAEMPAELVALSGGGSVVPKLRGADYTRVVVQRHKAMLLS